MNELSRRFDQKDIKLIAEVEKILLSAACCDEKIVVPEVVKNTYQSDI